MMCQGCIDVVFNSYTRTASFSLSDQDIVDFIDLFDKNLCEIETLLVENKLVSDDLIEYLKEEVCVHSS